MTHGWRAGRGLKLVNPRCDGVQCALYMHTVHTHTLYMHTADAPSVCTLLMHTKCAQCRCTLYIHTTCTLYMHAADAPSVSTLCTHPGCKQCSATCWGPTAGAIFLLHTDSDYAPVHYDKHEPAPLPKSSCADRWPGRPLSHVDMRFLVQHSAHLCPEELVHFCPCMRPCTDFPFRCL